MIQTEEHAAAFPSLEAVMHFGLFGCANLTHASDAARIRCLGENRRGHIAPRKSPARAEGFSAYLRGKVWHA